MAFAIGAQAVTTIHTIKAKSTDMITFPEIGNPVKTPTFTVTSGSPAFFNTNSGYWEKKVNGVWQSVSNGNFTEGTYRFTIYVHLPLDSGYIFDEETTVWVNDIKWATDYLYAWDHESAVRARSPEITVHLITTIYQVEGTSTDLTNMPVIGESVEEDPQITVTKGAPAYFDTDEYNACWEKLVDGEWKSYHSGTTSHTSSTGSTITI